MYIGRKAHHLKPGDMLLIPPGIKHHAFNIEENLPCQRFIFWISQDYCEKLLELSEDYVYLLKHAQSKKQYLYHYDTIAFNAVQAKIFRLIEEIHANRFGKAAKIQLCVNDLMLHINRAVYEMEHPTTRKEADALYDSLIQYIESHLEEDLSLDELSKIFFDVWF